MFFWASLSKQYYSTSCSITSTSISETDLFSKLFNWVYWLREASLLWVTSSLWLQTETLVERKVNNTTETAKPFGDKKVKVIPHVIDFAWTLNLALPCFFTTSLFWSILLSSSFWQSQIFFNLKYSAPTIGREG